MIGTIEGMNNTPSSNLAQTYDPPELSGLPVKGTPFTSQEIEKFLVDFHRDGCVHLGNLLTQEEVAALKQSIDEVFADPKAIEEARQYSPIVSVRLFESRRLFRDMLVREPIVGLMEKLVSPDCHLMASNAVRNGKGQGITSFHVDDVLCFPLPQEIEQFDPRMTIPCLMLNVQVALTDIPSDEFGPTQYVPGSHYSGRHPNDTANPTWQGRKPVSIYCKAGDVYLQHSQVWHRGAPNSSDTTRYLFQLAYARRFISQRFYPFLNYKMPDRVLEGADERLLRLLGKHPKGAYG